MFSDELRKLILNLRKSNKSYTEISKDLNMSRRSIISVCTYKRRAHKLKRGPQSLINKRFSTRIRRYINEKNINGIHVDCNAIKRDLKLNFSRRTINNFLLRNEYSYKKVAQEISLSANHKTERVKLCSLWLEKNINWNTSIFTDEKYFDLDGPKNW